ncbi:MAG: hypothetical protein WEC12_00325 [Balneolaceae bacterium]
MIHTKYTFCTILACIGLLLTASATSAAADDDYQTDPVHVTVIEDEGFEREEEPVEVEITLPMPEDAGQDVADWIRSRVRVMDLNSGAPQEIPSQVFDVRLDGSSAIARARVAFFASVEANSTARYRIDRNEAPGGVESDLSVRGDGVVRTIENEHFRILTEDPSGQIDQIDLQFADEPSFRFAPGTMHWNPDFIIVDDNYPDGGYDWLAARYMEYPQYEAESGPVFFSIKRRQLVPGQDKMFVEVYYRFYAGKPWFVMESRMEAVEDFRTFALRNDELAFGIGDFTHAGWRAQSVGLHPSHRGELGKIPLYDQDDRHSRHALGSSLSPNLPWLSYSHPERGYAVATLRLGWDNRNVLTGGPAPLVNSRTVLSDNNGAPYWFRSLVYTPRRAESEDFFNLSQDVINEMVQLIPRGSSYFERNVYLFYPFDSETEYEPVDDLYLRLTRPLKVETDI